MPIPTLLRRVSWIAVVTFAALTPHVLSAQERPQKVIVTFYHGMSGRSQPVNRQLPGKSPEVTLDETLDLAMPEGSQVCVRVLNPHPVFYRYALMRAVDTSQVTLPPATSAIASIIDVALQSGARVSQAQATLKRGMVAAAVARAPAGQRAQAARDAETASLPEWVTSYNESLAGLAKDVADVRQAVTRSNLPEELTYQGATAIGVIASGQDRGYDHVGAIINTQLSTPGRFQDPKLSESLKRFHEDASKQIGRQPEGAEQLVLDALRERGERLLEARNLLKATYGAPGSEHRECITIGRGVTTVKLGVHRADTSVAAVRDTGNALATVSVTSFFPRRTVEVLATSFAIGARVPEFSVGADGRVVEDRDNAFVFRPGAMLLYNPLVWGTDRSNALGVAVGVGLLGGKVALSDYLGGAVISFRDLLRIGAGAGWARLPNRLKDPARVGEPLPNGIGNLRDVVVERGQAAGYFMVSLPGLKLPGIQ